MSEQMREQGAMSAFDWRRWTVLAVIGLVAFLLLALLLDAPVTRALTQWPAEERAFFAALTPWGESDWILYPTFFIWLGALALNFFPMGWSVRWAVRAVGALSGFLFVSVGAPGLVSALLKRLIGRARPTELDQFGTLWFEPGAWAQYSLQGLPSGHATTSFALAFALVALFGRWWAVAYALAALIALSRIVLGVHFLSDALAGALLGTFGAMLVRAVFIRRGWIFDADGNNRMLAPLRLWWRRLSRPRRRGNA